MAEGTTSVEPASGAEKAPTARPEAFGAQGIWGSRERAQEETGTGQVTVVRQSGGVSHT